MHSPITKGKEMFCIRFAPSQWALVSHRLAAPEAIAQALTDHAEGEAPAVPDSPEAVAECACEMALDGPTLLIGTRLQKAVLLEACEGATFFAGLDQEDRRAIEKKLFDHLGEHVHIPRG